VAHVDSGAHGSRARREVREHHRVGRVLEQVDDERGRERRDARIAEGVGGELTRDDALHGGGLSGLERHGV